MIELTVNGRRHRLDVPGEALLLHILRNDLALRGPKYGCGLGECGACAVLIEGRAARACAVSCAAAEGRPIVTLEGLAADGRLDPVQEAFIAEQGAQCGYCLNGMIITIRALLNAGPAPDEAAIRHALRYSLCRCGTHVEILRAARRACGLDPAGMSP